MVEWYCYAPRQICLLVFWGSTPAPWIIFCSEILCECIISAPCSFLYVLLFVFYWDCSYHQKVLMGWCVPLLWESLSREIKIEEAMEAKLLSKLELSYVLNKWLIQYHSRECCYPFKNHDSYILPQPQPCPFGKIRSVPLDFYWHWFIILNSCFFWNLNCVLQETVKMAYFLIELLYP